MDLEIDVDLAILWRFCRLWGDEILKLCIIHGGDIPMLKSGSGSYFVVIETGRKLYRTKIIERLLNCGLNIHYKNDILLRTAVNYGDEKETEYLLIRGANPNINDGELYRLTENWGNIRILNLLQRYSKYESRN